MFESVCRTCLAANTRMHDLRSTQLREIFEKLTSSKLSTEDGRTKICYICYSQLQRCNRFYNMSAKADRMFREIAAKESKLNEKSVSALRPTNNFIVTPVDSMSFPDHTVETLVTVKIEPMDVKEEVELNESEIYEAVQIEGSSLADDFMKRVCEKTINNNEMGDEKPYACNICNKTFYNQKTWKRHRSAHDTNNTIHICECGKEFSTPQSLKRHSIVHSMETVCPFCAKTFHKESTFQNHLRTHKTEHVCHLCLKEFPEQTSLFTHLATHTELKPFICGVCNKAFSRKKFLDVHLRSHTGERPYSCDLCPKTFTQVGHAISHKRSHGKPTLDLAKPFPCTRCEMKFSERNTLKKHLRTHTGEKPFACEVCDKTFAARDTVKSHMRCHTGEKPYVCKKCGKAFSVRGNMRKHEKTHQESD